MAKKKDLVKAAQDATRSMFGAPAGVPETSRDTTGKKDATPAGERPQDAPEAPEKRRRGRPKKNPAETSGMENKPVLEAMLKERRQATEDGRKIIISVPDQDPEAKMVTRKVEFVDKIPTTPTSKTIEVTKPTKKNRSKDNGEYLRLDMMTDEADLKEYVRKMAGVHGVSMTAYIQNLILKDMKKNKGKTFTITV